MKSDTPAQDEYFDMLEDESDAYFGGIGSIDRETFEFLMTFIAILLICGGIGCVCFAIAFAFGYRWRQK